MVLILLSAEQIVRPFSVVLISEIFVVRNTQFPDRWMNHLVMVPISSVHSTPVVGNPLLSPTLWKIHRSASIACCLHHCSCACMAAISHALKNMLLDMVVLCDWHNSIAKVTLFSTNFIDITKTIIISFALRSEVSPHDSHCVKTNCR